MAQPNDADTVTCPPRAGPVVKRARPTPRVEKGTHKVNEHAVRVRASKILYALIKIAGSEEETQREREAILSVIKGDIDEVVKDFGLNKENVMSESERYTTDVKHEVIHSEGIVALQTACAMLSSVVAEMSQKTRAEDDVFEVVDAAIGDGMAVSGVRQQHPDRKRVRGEIGQIESALDRVQSSVKRIKEANDTSGRRSSLRRKSEED